MQVNLPCTTIPPPPDEKAKPPGSSSSSNNNTGNTSSESGFYLHKLKKRVSLNIAIPSAGSKAAPDYSDLASASGNVVFSGNFQQHSDKEMNTPLSSLVPSRKGSAIMGVAIEQQSQTLSQTQQNQAQGQMPLNTSQSQVQQQQQQQQQPQRVNTMALRNSLATIVEQRQSAMTGDAEQDETGLSSESPHSSPVNNPMNKIGEINSRTSAAILLKQERPAIRKQSAPATILTGAISIHNALFNFGGNTSKNTINQVASNPEEVEAVSNTPTTVAATIGVTAVPVHSSSEQIQVQNPQSQQQSTPNEATFIEVNTHRLPISQLRRVKVLGHGSSGLVELAIHDGTGILVGIKSIPLMMNSSFRKQLDQELKTLISCDSPGIVRCYGAYMQKCMVNITLEYMDVGTVHDLVKKLGPLPEAIVATIGIQVLRGLDYIHNRAKVIHRDIKPSNLLVSSEGAVKIADFGVSANLESAMEAKNWVGTVTYMSPERFRGQAYSANTDIWSLGLSMCEAALGVYPYFDTSQYEKKENLSFWEFLEYFNIKPAPRLPDSFAEEIKDFVAKCFKKSPLERPTAADLLNHPMIKKHDTRETQQFFVDWIKENGLKSATSFPLQESIPIVHKNSVTLDSQVVPSAPNQLEISTKIPTTTNQPIPISFPAVTTASASSPFPPQTLPQQLSLLSSQEIENSKTIKAVQAIAEKSNANEPSDDYPKQNLNPNESLQQPMNNNSSNMQAPILSVNSSLTPIGVLDLPLRSNISVESLNIPSPNPVNSNNNLKPIIQPSSLSSQVGLTHTANQAQKVHQATGITLNVIAAKAQMSGPQSSHSKVSYSSCYSNSSNSNSTSNAINRKATSGSSDMNSITDNATAPSEDSLFIKGISFSDLYRPPEQQIPLPKTLPQANFLPDSSTKKYLGTNGSGGGGRIIAATAASASAAAMIPGKLKRNSEQLKIVSTKSLAAFASRLSLPPTFVHGHGINNLQQNEFGSLEQEQRAQKEQKLLRDNHNNNNNVAIDDVQLMSNREQSNKVLNGIMKPTHKTSLSGHMQQHQQQLQQNQFEERTASSCTSISNVSFNNEENSNSITGHTNNNINSSSTNAIMRACRLQDSVRDSLMSAWNQPSSTSLYASETFAQHSQNFNSKGNQEQQQQPFMPRVENPIRTVKNSNQQPQQHLLQPSTSSSKELGGSRIIESEEVIDVLNARISQETAAARNILNSEEQPRKIIDSILASVALKVKQRILEQLPAMVSSEFNSQLTQTLAAISSSFENIGATPTTTASAGIPNHHHSGQTATLSGSVSHFSLFEQHQQPTFTQQQQQQQSQQLQSSSSSQPVYQQSDEGQKGKVSLHQQQQSLDFIGGSTVQSISELNSYAVSPENRSAAAAAAAAIVVGGGENRGTDLQSSLNNSHGLLRLISSKSSASSNQNTSRLATSQTGFPAGILQSANETTLNRKRSTRQPSEIFPNVISTTTTSSTNLFQNIQQQQQQLPQQQQQSSDSAPHKTTDFELSKAIQKQLEVSKTISVAATPYPPQQLIQSAPQPTQVLQNPNKKQSLSSFDSPLVSESKKGNNSANNNNIATASITSTTNFSTTQIRSRGSISGFQQADE